jgi:hypothetical protein
MNLWIELISERHGVQTRTRFESFPVRIGRSYACHFLVDSAVVAPEHLEIDLGEDGVPVARALGENTFTVEGLPGTHREFSMNAESMIRLGHGLIRVRTDRDLLEASDQAPEVLTPVQRVRRFALAASPALAALVLDAADKWLNSTDGDFLVEMLTTGFWQIIIVVAWVAVTAMIAYSLHHDSRLLKLLRAAGYGMLGVALVHGVLPVAMAAVNAGTGERFSQFFVPFVISISVLLSFFYMLRKRPLTRMYATLGLLLAAAIGGVSCYQDYRGDAVQASPQIARLVPSFVQLSPSQDRGEVLKSFAGMEKDLAASRTGEIPDEVR